MKKRAIIVGGLLVSLVPGVAKAHCPLCTAGAGALAVLAASFGVSTMAVGAFIGAFAVALSLWMARLVKKTYVPYQKTIISIVVFLATVLPMLPLIDGYMSINIYWFGSYGNPFNRTYMLHSFLTGTAIGAGIMLISPTISAWVKRARGGKLLPYQGVMITMVLLLVTALTIQFGL